MCVCVKNRPCGWVVCGQLPGHLPHVASVHEISRRRAAAIAHLENRVCAAASLVPAGADLVAVNWPWTRGQ